MNDDSLSKRATQHALDDLIKYARKVAYVDDDHSVGTEEFYHKLQLAASLLSGLKAAVIRYDETLEFFEEEDKQDDG